MFLKVARVFNQEWKTTNFVLCFYFPILTKMSWIMKYKVNHMIEMLQELKTVNLIFRDFVCIIISALLLMVGFIYRHDL